MRAHSFLRIVLAAVLALIFGAPRLLQDIHRFFGHEHILIQCACNNSDASCSLRNYKEVCSVCSFEFVQLTVEDFPVHLPAIVLLRQMQYGDYTADYQWIFPLFVFSRAPPVATNYFGA